MANNLPSIIQFTEDNIDRETLKYFSCVVKSLFYYSAGPINKDYIMHNLIRKESIPTYYAVNVIIDYSRPLKT